MIELKKIVVLFLLLVLLVGGFYYFISFEKESEKDNMVMLKFESEEKLVLSFPDDIDVNNIHNNSEIEISDQLNNRYDRIGLRNFVKKGNEFLISFEDFTKQSRVFDLIPYTTIAEDDFLNLLVSKPTGKELLPVKVPQKDFNNIIKQLVISDHSKTSYVYPLNKMKYKNVFNLYKEELPWEVNYNIEIDQTKNPSSNTFIIANNGDILRTGKATLDIKFNFKYGEKRSGFVIPVKFKIEKVE